MTRLSARGAELWSAGAGPADHVTEGAVGALARMGASWPWGVEVPPSWANVLLDGALPGGGTREKPAPLRL